MLEKKKFGYQISRKNGIVSMIDVLGTKILNKDDDFTDLIYQINKISKSIKKHACNIPHAEKPEIYSISDTVIISQECDFREGYAEIIRSIGSAMGHIIVKSAEKNIFLRGSIGIGKYFVGNGIVLGPAINEVGEHYDIANWIGFSASPSAVRILESSKPSTFVPYEIPTKLGPEWGYAVDLEPIYAKISDRAHSSFKDLILHASKDLVALDAIFKHRNTLKFLQRNSVGT